MLQEAPCKLDMDFTRAASFKCERVHASADDANGPENRGHSLKRGAVIVGHRCFVFGGFGQQEAVPAPTRIFDTVTNTWQLANDPGNEDLEACAVDTAFVFNEKLCALVWLQGKRCYCLAKLDLVMMGAWKTRELDSLAFKGDNKVKCASYNSLREEAFALVFHGSRSLIWVYSPEDEDSYTAITKGAEPKHESKFSSCSTGTELFISEYSPATGKTELYVMRARYRSRFFHLSKPSIRSNSLAQMSGKFTLTCTYNRLFIFGGSSFVIYSIGQQKWYDGVDSPKVNYKHQFRFVPLRTETEGIVEDSTAVQTSERMFVFGGKSLQCNEVLRTTPFA